MRRYVPYVALVLVALAVIATWRAKLPHDALPPAQLEETADRWDAKTTTRLAIWRPYGRGAAPMTICPGDGKCREISNTGPVDLADAPYYLTVARPEQLTITPEPTRISYLDPDPSPLKPGRYESDDQNIRYGGNWISQQLDGPSGGEVHTAMDSSSAVSFEFDGTGLEIGMVFHDDRRTSRLCIDGVCRDIGLFSHSLEWQQPILVYGLKPGRHLAKLQLTAGKAMDIDWIQVIGDVLPFEPGEYLPTDSHWFTTAGWTNGTSTALTAGAAFSFTGHEVALTFPTNADSGEIMLCMDGNCQVEDLFSVVDGERTIRASVAQGTHSVVLQKGPSHAMTLPKLQVF